MVGSTYKQKIKIKTQQKQIKIRIEPKQKGTCPNGQIPNCLLYNIPPEMSSNIL